MRLYPERWGEKGRTKGGIGSTHSMQRDPPLLCQTIPKSEPPSDGSASIPLIWVTVSTESLPLCSRPLGHGPVSGMTFFSCAQRRSCCICLSRVCDRESLWQSMYNTTAILSVLMMTWECARNRRKWTRAILTALISRLFMCQTRYLPVQTPQTGLPLKTAPHPEREASIIIIWWWQTNPIFTPFWRNSGSRHTERARDRPLTLLVGRETF